MMAADPLALLAAAVAALGSVGALLAGLAVRYALTIPHGDRLRRLMSTSMALVLVADLLATAAGAWLAFGWNCVAGGARG